MNAYVCWWSTWPNGLADSGGTIFKRAYAMGQFAKYVRPGYHRVDATANPENNVSVSALTGDDKVVIVAVNTGNGSVNQNVVFSNGTTAEVSSWQTSANSNRVAGETYPASDGSFSADLPGQSTTTFVGTVDAAGGGSSDGGTGGVVGSGGAGGDGSGPGTGGMSPTGGTHPTGGLPGVGGGTATETGGTLAWGGSGGTGTGGLTTMNTGVQLLVAPAWLGPGWRRRNHDARGRIEWLQLSGCWQRRRCAAFR